MTVETAPAPPAPSPDFQQLLLDFLAYLELERGLARNTLQSYRSDLMQFGSFLAVREVNARDVGSAHVSEFLTELATGARGAPVATATIQRKTASLRSFYRHLRREGLRDSDPTARLSAPRRRQMNGTPSRRASIRSCWRSTA